MAMSNVHWGTKECAQTMETTNPIANVFQNNLNIGYVIHGLPHYLLFFDKKVSANFAYVMYFDTKCSALSTKIKNQL
jgi:hypothetical protein